ncbi:MAG: glycosyl hydrolase, partial [Lachnospiraceae bacterium]|nr:glycosyl hydrolase [Lachnospiraceae bacterium]
MAKLLNYTRLPLEDAVYANRLAYSVHFALQNEDGSWMALNHNSGVLFVKATENADGSLNPKSLKNPWVFNLKDGGYGVFAIRTLAEGQEDTEDLGTAVFWTSKDLVRFDEAGLVKFTDGHISDVRCKAVDAGYQLQWQTADGAWKETCLKSLS